MNEVEPTPATPATAEREVDEVTLAELGAYAALTRATLTHTGGGFWVTITHNPAGTVEVIDSTGMLGIYADLATWEAGEDALYIGPIGCAVVHAAIDTTRKAISIPREDVSDLLRPREAGWNLLDVLFPGRDLMCKEYGLDDDDDDWSGITWEDVSEDGIDDDWQTFEVW